MIDFFELIQPNQTRQILQFLAHNTNIPNTQYKWNYICPQCKSYHTLTCQNWETLWEEEYCLRCTNCSYFPGFIFDLNMRQDQLTKEEIIARKSDISLFGEKKRGYIGFREIFSANEPRSNKFPNSCC